jgi:uncharacterized protein with ATP-grasp and redox domains
VAGGVRDEVRETLERDDVAVANGMGNRVRERYEALARQR